MTYVLVVVFEIYAGAFTPPVAVYAYDTLGECVEAMMPINAASVACEMRD